jgi:NADH-quinone oxidoreductase subunit C
MKKFKMPKTLSQEIKNFELLNSFILKREIFDKNLIILVDQSNLINVFKILKDEQDFAFTQLTDLCGVDLPHEEIRFQVVYNLLSMSNNSRITVKAFTDNSNSVPSIKKIYPAADWYEREAFDLYGINFSGHDDLRRILTDYGFEGHPLRKDFPLTGNVEVRYDPDQERVIYEKVDLKQEYRDFDFESAWKGFNYPENQNDIEESTDD